MVGGTRVQHDILKELYFIQATCWKRNFQQRIFVKKKAGLIILNIQEIPHYFHCIKTGLTTTLSKSK